MKNKVIKTLLFIIAMILILGIVIYLFPFLINLSTYEGQVAFKNEIDHLGIFGMGVLFLLQLLQILLIVLPGEPLELLAGICYGPIWGTLFTLISNHNSLSTGEDGGAVPTYTSFPLTVIIIEPVVEPISFLPFFLCFYYYKVNIFSNWKIGKKIFI